MDGQLVAIFGNPHGAINVGEIQLRVNVLSEHVHSQRYHINVARTLAVSKQRSFNSVRTRHYAQFSRRNACASVVVGVQ